MRKIGKVILYSNYYINFQMIKYYGDYYAILVYILQNIGGSLT